VLQPRHAVFQGPFPVEPRLEKTPTPANFKKYDPSLGDTIDTFGIYTKKSPEPGLVTSHFGFEEVPDAEMILGGINMKGPKFPAVARHGSFVMWGFHGSADDLTETGKRLFLNVIAFTAAQRGKRVETLREFQSRADVEAYFDIYTAMYLEDKSGAKHIQSGMELHFPGMKVPEAVLASGKEAKTWYREFAPFLRPAAAAGYRAAYALEIDAECKQLGIGNDKLEFLDAIAGRLAKDASDGLATSLLRRYCPDAPAGAFGPWLRKNRGNLYFTETGGYLWRVRGSDPPPRFRADSTDADDPVSVTADMTDKSVVVELTIRPGWHVYSPQSKEGDPVQISISENSNFSAAGGPLFEDDVHGKWTDSVRIRVPLKRKNYDGERLEIAVSYTVCDASTCRPRQTIHLTKTQ
jgi:hypothetical protein